MQEKKTARFERNPDKNANQNIKQFDTWKNKEKEKTKKRSKRSNN
jgi:hypothetical protein